MPHRARVFVLSVSTSSAMALFGGVSVSAQVQQPPSAGDRVLGLDISAWQGNLSQSQWAGFFNQGRKFAFIRASRGGTTGFYNQSDPNNLQGKNTLSQRYDDPYFVQNITNATNAGMLAGAYHYGRMDLLANDGANEADHFLQMAGAWMRPGYLLPVFDFEDGNPDRTGAQLSQFAIEFSNRIYDVKGIRPVIYIGSNYVNYTGNTTALAQTFPNLWMPRYVNQNDPNSIPVQTAQIDNYSSVNYGAWETAQNPQPWKIWQYASTGRLSGYGGDLDFNVAQGNIEFVKDMSVPALWTSSAGGNWSDLTSWNSGQDAGDRPTPGTGQVTPVGVNDANWDTAYKPDARLPGAEDNVDLDRPNDNVTVNLTTAANVRRLDLNERLNVTAGGSINTRLSGQIGAGGTLSLADGGVATFTEGYVNSLGVIEFAGAGTLNVGSLFVGSNGSVTVPTGATGMGVIQGKAGVANPSLNLMNGTRSFAVNEGSAPVDLRIAIPLTNGNLTKTGTGTLELTADNSAYAGNLFISGGNLRLTNANQIGTTGVRTSTSGAVQLDGNGLNVTRPINLGGRGFGNAGGLVNVSGDNTWSGNVVLTGEHHNQNDLQLNQVSAVTTTTLRLSGVIQDNTTAVLRSLAKSGGGDVVLTGASPNTYTNLTRVFDGRLIVEKDGALGATNQADAGASTIQLAGANSAVAFRAPTGSFGLNYAAQEWIFTEGNGANGAQLDSLGGANTFAGHVGLGGPVGTNGVRQSYLGVSAGSLELTGGLHARSQSAAEPRDVFKRGNGTLILSGSNGAGPSNIFARPLAGGSTFTVEAGTVQLKGTAGNGANVTGVDRWKVNTGGLLSLSQGGAAGNAAVEFNGGTLRAEQSMSSANALNFAGNGTVNTDAAAVTFTGPTSGFGRFAKSGAGNVALAGAVNGFGGTLAVNAGMVSVSANGTDAAVANLLGLTITPGATFDLADNDLIVRTTPPATIEGYVAAGYNNGAWDGTGGMISSSARGNELPYTLGVASNAVLNLGAFGGHTGLSAAATLVRYTFLGDADVSGVVNEADFERFRAGFTNQAPDAWLFGDFNYSGVVDGADFALYLRGLLNQPGGQLSPAFANELTTFAVDNGLDPTLVPEPTGFALLALGTGLLTRRRRPM